MFGRRRRAAPALQTPAPELSNEQIFELLHSKLTEIIGAEGRWTLVPRRSNDTDVIFHGMLAHQIAASLTELLHIQTAVLRGEAPQPNEAAPVEEAVPIAEAVLVGEQGADPSALSWTPAPISVWAEPERATITAPIRIPEAQPIETSRLVA